MKQKNRALIVGGSNGIGLAIAICLAKEQPILIVDKVEPDYDKISVHVRPFITFQRFDLLSDDYALFDEFSDIDTLVITAGCGNLSLFEDTSEETIINMLNLNTISVLRIIKHFYSKIHSISTFRTVVMVSIAGFMSSPFFSVYGASKAALKIFIESVNVELKKKGITNRILNVSPGQIKGTCFNGGVNNLSLIEPLAEEIIYRMKEGCDLFIPQYEEVFKNVLQRYYEDFRAEGEHSYDYKLLRLKEN